MNRGIMYVHPRISKAAATAYFERRRLSRLWGFLSARSGETGASTKTKRLPCLELIWLPYYIVAVKVISPRGPGEITVSVEGHSGAFAIFDMHDALAQGEPQGETFPPKLSEAEAVAVGRAELLKAILRRRGQRGKPLIEGVGEVSLLHYPLWVYHYERRRGYQDFKLLDAATGKKCGIKTKRGVLSAFLGERNGAADQPAPREVRR